MRAKVVKVFIDKETKVLQKPGKTIDVSKGRYQAINGTAYGTFLEEIREPTKNKKK